jgi:hypothetical protein
VDQAMGSDVAAETSSMAERNAPAMIVAVSRRVAMLNIGIPLVIVLPDPTIGSMAFSMHGSCQLEKIVVYQCLKFIDRVRPGQITPSVGEKYQLLCKKSAGGRVPSR